MDYDILFKHPGIYVTLSPCLCHLSSSATLTWTSWSLCPASEDQSTFTPYTRN